MSKATDELKQQLLGRAQFLENRGEVKTPGLLRCAASALSGDVMALNPETGRWYPAIPEPFYFGLFPWAWRRLTGYRDEYGRKAQLMLPWEA